MWKVVIIEDEDLLREGLKNCFDWEKRGFVIAGDADNGKTALTLIRELKPDIVFTDIKMPFMDGITMTEKLRENYPEIKVVIISGYDEFEFARRALKAGVSEYLLKPVNLKQLEELLGKLERELREKEEKSREWDRLYELEENSRSSIRQKFLEKLLRRKIAPEEMERESAVVYQEISRLHYVVGIIDRRDYDMLSAECDYLEMVELDGRFEQRVRQFISDEDKVDILRENNCERILCVRGETESECRELRERLKGLLGTCRDDGIECVFSHVCKGIEGVYSAYVYARGLLRKQYARSLEEVLHEAASVDTKIQYMNYDADKLFYEIRSGTKEQVEQEVERFEEELNREKIISHMHLVLILSNLYFSLTKLPGEIGGDINDILGEPMEHYHRMLLCEKREEMLAYLKDICLKVNDYFLKMGEGKAKGILKRITDYMKEHYGNEELSMKDVAKQAYISVSYMGIILKKETGKTFIEYLTQIRIEQAKRYLTETELKNYEIALKCGYSNPTYFSTVFKSVTGRSPSSYRKEQKDKY